MAELANLNQLLNISTYTTLMNRALNNSQLSADLAEQIQTTHFQWKANNSL